MPRLAAYLQSDRTAATLTYQFSDNLSPSALAVLQIRNNAGKVVKTLRKVFPAAPAVTVHTQSFECLLPVGRYKWTVTVVDMAGNGTLSVVRTLTVR